MQASSGSAAPPAYMLYLDQSAHLDWDWIKTFGQNYFCYRAGQGVEAIFDAALVNLSASGGYHYSVCEMGYFRRYLERRPEAVETIKGYGDRFQVMGGGVTSPDCMVCAGEAFIRNYLIGQSWLSRVVGLTAQPHCWLPDDFGQAPDLPALLTALGFRSVGFSRLPGTLGTCARNQPQDGLKATGLYFTWQAPDGSALLAHWMNGGYGAGNGPGGGLTPIATLCQLYSPSSATPPTYAAAPAGLMYIPIDIDFSMPVDGLLGSIAEWNANQAATANVAATAGSFADFADAVLASGTALPPTPYNGTPYWTGHYASRPGLKILHYEALAALLAAEAFALMTQPANASLNTMLPARFWSDLEACWEDFAPSTHHDYVNGTALDGVYATEQLPLLRGVAGRAKGLRDTALNALAGMIDYSDYSWIGPQNGVLVANPLGFQRTGLAEVEDVAYWTSPGGDENLLPVASVSVDNGPATPVQRAYEGGMLFIAPGVPSFGYGFAMLSSAPAAVPAGAAALSAAPDGSSFTLSNGLVSATLSATGLWGLASLVDVAAGNLELLALSGGGNALRFYDEMNRYVNGNDVSGNLYQFGNEYADQGGTLTLDEGVEVTVEGPGLGAFILESGPVRARVRTIVEVSARGEAVRFTRDYALVAGEPFLRCATTGRAPDGYSVMAAFPFASAVAGIRHGTAGHWTGTAPLAGFWGPPTFRATHHYLLPDDANGAPVAAIYHEAMPAWAFDPEGVLIGCLLRNTPNAGQHGAAGTDTGVHTQSYAIRVPSGLGAPESGAPLKEALGFSRPLSAVPLPAGGYNPQGGGLPGTLSVQPFSLASAGSGAAILTAAKPGTYDPTTLILRLYQPTNQPLTVTVTVDGNPASVTLVTAAETPWQGGGSATVGTDGAVVQMQGALATLALPGLGRPALKA